SQSQSSAHLESEYVSATLLERSMKGEIKTAPRIPLNFPTCNQFLGPATKGLRNSGAVWDEVVSVEEMPDFDEDVYDFTTASDAHNFIANGFVVSNCGVWPI